jgi:hypothetical protein
MRCLARLQSIVITGALLLGLAVPAQSTPIPIGGLWSEFSFTPAQPFAAGCAPADPAGLICFPSVSGNSTFIGAPPWTFVAPATGTTFTITDAFTRGDSFNVFDSGTLVGSTPAVAAVGTCGSDPMVCLADPLSSHGIFSIGAGNHSITIEPIVEAFGPGSAYFRVDAETPIPEPYPARLLLLGLGPLGVCLIARALHR